MKYEYQFNPDSNVSPFGYAFNAVQTGSRVLDLGCGFGSLLLELKQKKNCKILGLDLQKSENSGFEPGDVYQINLIEETEKLKKFILDFKPDTVMMLDFLEHLANPDLFFDNVLSVLPVNTQFIISLPNIANFSILLRLFEDQFDYAESGLLDKTHVHFFTVKSFLSFLSKRPFEISDMSHICLPIESQEWKSSLPKGIQDDLIGLYCQHNPYGNSYQFCVTGRKTSEIKPESVMESERVYSDHLSVIVRFHEGASLEMLDLALFSLAGSQYEDLEVIIVGQNLTPETTAKISESVSLQPWSNKTKTRLEVVQIGNRDGRSELINIGIGLSTGRYIAFLDYDDVVYQRGYSTLIDKLKNSTAAIAVGGCRRAGVESAQNIYSITFKDKPYVWGGVSDDLFQDNFVPIHSYVIDRTRCNSKFLNFDVNLSRLEDYAFLIKIAANHEINFDLINFSVCEYRIRQDGTNSVMDGGDENDLVKKEAWIKSGMQIDQLKSSLYVVHSVKEIGDLRKELHKERTLRIQQERELNRFTTKVLIKLRKNFERIPHLKSFLVGTLRALKLVK